MNIYVYESENLSDFTLCGVLDSYKSFNFTKKFQGCGSWTIKGLYTPEAALLLKAERIIYVNKKMLREKKQLKLLVQLYKLSIA